MTEITPPLPPTPRIAKNISAVVGTPPTLPGESAEHYRQGLHSLIEELEAKTVMQVYLAEKIFECLWWMQRYEQQKRASLAQAMTVMLTGTHAERFTADEYQVMDSILDPARRSELEELYEASGYTELSLMQRAFMRHSGRIEEYNNQIAMLAKTLSGFQASYEVLANRKLHRERLRLQNELLSRDIGAIEMEAVPDADQS